MTATRARSGSTSLSRVEPFSASWRTRTCWKASERYSPGLVMLNNEALRDRIGNL